MKKKLLAGALLLILLLTALPMAFSASALQVHYIDVGQADSIFIKAPNGETILIDAGNNGDAKTIVDYLKKQKVKKLDYVIGTHPHEDHIGSLDTIINTFSIGKIIMPKVTSNTSTYKDVVNAIKKKKLKVTTPVPGTKYKLGGVNLEILAPNESKYKDLNDYSVVSKLTYNKTSFLFTGDAETVSENEMIKKKRNLSATVLKVGHHGSQYGTSSSFLDKVKPKYAIVSVGKGNKYGHPTKSTLDRLKGKKITTYRTDQHGTVVATSDGKNVLFKTQKTPKTTPSLVATTKVTAKVDNATPKQYSTVKLTVTGPENAKVTAVCNYKSTDTTYTATIGPNKQAVISIPVSRAAKGFKVIVDISVTSGGKTTKVQTAFTPQ